MPADPNRFARDLFTPLPARYDLLAEILSFGQNGRWRSAMVDHVLSGSAGGGGAGGVVGDGGGGGAGGEGGGGVILDVASGTAGVALQLAARGGVGDGVVGGMADGAAGGGRRAAADGAVGGGGNGTADGAVGGGGNGTADGAVGGGGNETAGGGRRGVRVVGVDLTEEMLREGRRRVAAAGRDGQVRLVAGRAEQLPFPDEYFDALTFTYLLRYVKDPQATLGELARVLKPGGTMASLEFCVPTGAVWHPAWWAYTRLALPAGGWLLGGREWFRVGRFLGPNISGHYRRYPVSWTVEAWQKAGFADVGVRVMSLGGGLVMWGTRAGA